jgi:hypothetical protein
VTTTSTKTDRTATTISTLSTDTSSTAGDIVLMLAQSGMILHCCATVRHIFGTSPETSRVS